MKKKGKKQKQAVIARLSEDEEQEHDVHLQQKLDVGEKNKGGKKNKRAVIVDSSADEEQENDDQLQQKMDVEEMQNMDDDKEDVTMSNDAASVQIRQTQSMPAPRSRAPPPPPRNLPKKNRAQKKATPIAERKPITERDLIQGAARLKTVKRNFNPGWLHFTCDRLYSRV